MTTPPFFDLGFDLHFSAKQLEIIAAFCEDHGVTVSEGIQMLLDTAITQYNKMFVMK